MKCIAHKWLTLKTILCSSDIAYANKQRPDYQANAYSFVFQICMRKPNINLVQDLYWLTLLCKHSLDENNLTMIWVFSQKKYKIQ